MTVLVILHQILNRKWYVSLFRGKYNPVRILNTGVNLLLFSAFAASAISGMSLSEYAVPALRNLLPPVTARLTHLSASYWAFVLMGIHSGLHWGVISSKLRFSVKTAFFPRVFVTIAAAYGFYLFLKNRVFIYLLCQTHFAFLDYETPPAIVLSENLFMLLFWVWLSYKLSGSLRVHEKRDINQLLGTGLFFLWGYVMKKNLLWIVSTLFIFSLAAFSLVRFSGNAAAVENNAENQNQNQYAIQAVGHTDSEITIALKNQTANAVSVQLIAVAYSETGRMLTVNTVSQSLKNAEETQVTVSLPDNADTVKAFVLDASTLSPLRSAWKWEREEPESAGKILVAYFSATGSTKKIAEHITNILNADIYAITPAVPYTSDDLNYNNNSSRATAEQNDASARPAISGTVTNMKEYKIIFLGYPIWWGQAPRIVSTFLESYDFTGKTIVPFCTSGSSPIGNSAENLHALASGAVWESGRRFAGSASRASIEEWINGLNLPLNEETDAPKVYFTSDISPEGLVKAYQALNWTPTGKVAVKLSTGEPPNSNYLRPDLIGDLVKSINGTIVECNTAYGGSRASSAMHKQVAEDHGFTAIADFDLMDEDGEKDIPVTGGVRLDRAIVGTHIDNYDNFLILSHFKGHAMAGLGGAIKNVAIGMSSASGKVLVHTAGERTTGSIWYSDQDAWLEALPEMVTAVRDYIGAENIVYINVMNRLSVDCDCDGNPAEPNMHDIGILASYDPVALDQACVDLVYSAPDGASLQARMERQHGIHALEHGEKIGLGNRTYELVNLDG